MGSVLISSIFSNNFFLFNSIGFEGFKPILSLRGFKLIFSLPISVLVSLTSVLASVDIKNDDTLIEHKRVSVSSVLNNQFLLEVKSGD